MRALHRIIGIVVMGLLLWLGGTGALMQSLDLYKLTIHAPESDPTMMSLNEGKYGPADFSVITERDFTAAVLPPTFNYSQAVDTVIEAIHTQSGGVQPRFVEWRILNGIPIARVGIGAQTLAFDATTGVAVASSNIASLSPLELPMSVRQRTKQLHRFWIRNFFPGVWIEVLSGLVLLIMTTTGVVMYFRLLSARRRLSRFNPFWSAGGLWRALHRSISIIAAVFLLAIAFSGTWIGYESVYGSFHFGPPVDVSAPLSDGDVRQMVSGTINAMRRVEPLTPIKVLRVRVYGAMKQGITITGGEGETRQLVFNAVNGKPASLTEPEYPKSGFPFGVQVHENVKHFHSGMLFGLAARWMGLFAGLSLMYLSISGLVMYFQLWLKRRSGERYSFFWV
jgi:hypothetical protein